jgi:tetratricopeptide (TPR) repeat protein
MRTPAFRHRQAALRVSGRALLAIVAALIAFGAAGCFSPSQVGIDAYESGDWEKATKYLREAILNEKEGRDKLMPLYVSATTRLADQYAAQGRYESAFEVIQKARQEGFSRDSAELRRANVDLHLRLGRESLEKGNLDLAKTQVDEVRRIDPTNEEARRIESELKLIVGNRFYDAGQLDDALIFYKEYLAEYPDNQAVRGRAAQTLLQQGRRAAQRNQTAEALRLFAQTLAFQPDSREAMEEALKASASTTDRILINNYTELLKLAPQNRVMRERILRQLENRSRDRLEQEEPGPARALLFAAYELDDQAKKRLPEYQARVMEIVNFSLQRSDMRDVQNGLTEAGKTMPPLAAEFESQKVRIKDEHERFYILASDDLLLVKQVDQRLRDALPHATETQVQKEIREAFNQLKLQKDALSDVTNRQKSRAAMDKRPFKPPQHLLARIGKILSASEFEQYQELLQRYSGK